MFERSVLERGWCKADRAVWLGVSSEEGLGGTNLAEAPLPDYLYPPAHVPGAWHSVHGSGRREINFISRIPAHRRKKKSGLCFLSHPPDGHTNNSPAVKQRPVSTEFKDPALGL